VEQGKLLKLHRLAKIATEDFGRFGIRQFASRHLQLFSNEFGGALEGQGHKRSNVVQLRLFDMACRREPDP